MFHYYSLPPSHVPPLLPWVSPPLSLPPSFALFLSEHYTVSLWCVCVWGLSSKRAPCPPPLPASPTPPCALFPPAPCHHRPKSEGGPEGRCDWVLIPDGFRQEDVKWTQWGSRTGEAWSTLLLWYRNRHGPMSGYHITAVEWGWLVEWVSEWYLFAMDFARQIVNKWSSSTRSCANLQIFWVPTLMDILMKCPSMCIICYIICNIWYTWFTCNVKF